jgi:hypothetical protein
LAVSLVAGGFACSAGDSFKRGSGGGPDSQNENTTPEEAMDAAVQMEPESQDKGAMTEDPASPEPPPQPEMMACAEGCSREAPLCHEEKGCVECLESTDCAGQTEHKTCDPISNNCVECVDSTGCPTLLRSRCDDGTCRPCRFNDECSHFRQYPICHYNKCVACLSTKDCKGPGGELYVCDTKNQNCTATQAYTRGVCEPCSTDDECAIGICASNFNGSFCFESYVEGCSPPFTYKEARRIDSDVKTTICGLNVSSCAGYLKHGDACTADADCGSPFSGAGEQCVSGTCRMRCESHEDCPSGNACTLRSASGSYPYCYPI